MRPSFFIFSLPRSGSSWLSVFLTGPDSFCYHEPTADYDIPTWEGMAKARPERIVGAVDTGAYIQAPEIWNSFPKAKFFSLVRDPHEINKSSRWIGIENYDAYKEREVLDSLKHEKILYSKIWDLGYLEEIWDRVIGTRFDSERARLLKEMRIERDVFSFFNIRPEIALAAGYELIH